MVTAHIDVSRALKKLRNAGMNAKRAYKKALWESTQLVRNEVKFSIAGMRSEPRSVQFGGFLNTVSYEISPTKAIVYSPLEYAKFLEYGTSPHFVSPKAGGVLSWTEGPHGGGKRYFSKGHMVSGISPRRHFRNSARRAKPKVIRIFDKLIRTNVRKAR